MAMVFISGRAYEYQHPDTLYPAHDQASTKASHSRQLSTATWTEVIEKLNVSAPQNTSIHEIVIPTRAHALQSLLVISLMVSTAYLLFWLLCSTIRRLRKGEDFLIHDSAI